MKHNLLQSNNISPDFLEQLLLSLTNKQVDFADIYMQKSCNQSWSLDESIIKSGSFSVDQGIGIRAICGEKSFSGYTNIFKESAVKNIADSLFIEQSSFRLPKQIVNSKKVLHDLYTTTNSIFSADNKAKIALLQNIDQQARTLPFVTNVIAQLGLSFEEIAIANTNIVHADHHGVITDIRPMIRLMVTIVITKDGKLEKGYAGGGGRHEFKYFTPDIVKEYIQHSYQQALDKIDAKPCPKGEMPVVLGNSWAGVILHEAIGHGLEGDFNRKKTSAFAGKIGEQVASKGVTVVDNGTIAGRRGSLNVDDEGNPTQNTVLIEDGILKGYLYDELNARLMGVASTGNGRRQSYASIPIPRMTNTYMLNGKYAPEEVIASVKDGIYAADFAGGQVDITSGSFVFDATSAWKIENGKLAYPVKGCALVGSGPDCLKYVTMIGNNSALDSGIGNCGKDGQTVPVGVGQPTIRLDGGLTVGS